MHHSEPTLRYAVRQISNSGIYPPQTIARFLWKADAEEYCDLQLARADKSTYEIVFDIEIFTGEF
jgi:hypothetical protein